MSPAADALRELGANVIVNEWVPPGEVYVMADPERPATHLPNDYREWPPGRQLEWAIDHNLVLVIKGVALDDAPTDTAR